jgi:hypothetical protein
MCLKLSRVCDSVYTLKRVLKMIVNEPTLVLPSAV